MPFALHAIMAPEFLKKAHDVLADMRGQVLRTAIDEVSDEDTNDGPGDVYDVATEERARELDALLSHRDRDKLEAIEQALTRLDEGSYGTCEECDEDIAEGRLELLPFTRLCVTCQTAREREDAQHRRRPAQPRSGLDLAALDVDDE